MFKRILATILLLALMLVLAPFSAAAPSIAYADEHSFTRVDGEVRGALYSLFRPDEWNGDLVLLVHGSVPGFFNFWAQRLAAQGFGVAYSTNPPGAPLGEGKPLRDFTINTRIVQDLFTANFGSPERTYLYGFSRGSHNMSTLLETSPERYDGMYSVCGANGDGQLSWDYFFAARVLFDYYFPGVLPGEPLNMPDISEDMYFSEVAPDIAAAILANPSAAEEMAAVDQYELPYVGFDELVEGIIVSLRPHTTGINFFLQAGNGNPFDNTQTIYAGSSDDEALNAGVARLSAVPQARAYLQVWSEPDGTIDGTPVLALHTSHDPNIPERLHNDRYEALVQSTGNGEFFVRRVIDRFGHCAFSFEEMESGFIDLVNWVETGERPTPLASRAENVAGGFRNKLTGKEGNHVN